MKHAFAKAALVLALTSTAALAQTTGTPPQPVPPAGAPAVTPAPGTMGQTGSGSGQAGTATGQMWYTQTGNEWRGSRLIGTRVQNAAGERIGDINEIVIGNDGSVQAVIVGVGGFLGIGEREVAMHFGALNMTRDSNGNTVVTTSATRDMLQSAPQWTWRAAAN